MSSAEEKKAERERQKALREEERERKKQEREAARAAKAAGRGDASSRAGGRDTPAPAPAPAPPAGMERLAELLCADAPFEWPPPRPPADGGGVLVRLHIQGSKGGEPAPIDAALALEKLAGTELPPAAGEGGAAAAAVVVEAGPPLKLGAVRLVGLAQRQAEAAVRLQSVQRGRLGRRQAAAARKRREEERAAAEAEVRRLAALAEAARIAKEVLIMIWHAGEALIDWNLSRLCRICCCQEIEACRRRRRDAGRSRSDRKKRARRCCSRSCAHTSRAYRTGMQWWRGGGPRQPCRACYACRRRGGPTSASVGHRWRSSGGCAATSRHSATAASSRVSERCRRCTAAASRGGSTADGSAPRQRGRPRL
jgi:hypothetical protein